MKKNEIPQGLKEVTKEIVGWEDNKLFRTISHLTTKPGVVITEYCKGEKTKYLSPVIYFFGTSAVETFLLSISGLMDFILKIGEQSINPILKSESGSDKWISILVFLSSEAGQKLALLPILLATTWLVYKKCNNSFKENSWLTLYTVGHVTLLNIPLMLYLYITKDMILYGLFYNVVAASYWVWTTNQFYSLKIAKSVFLCLLMLVVLILFVTVIGGLALYFIASNATLSS